MGSVVAFLMVAVSLISVFFQLTRKHSLDGYADLAQIALGHDTLPVLSVQAIATGIAPEAPRVALARAPATVAAGVTRRHGCARRRFKETSTCIAWMPRGYAAPRGCGPCG